MPLPRHRPNPNLLRSDPEAQERDENLGDYHYVYRTGPHDPSNGGTASGPEFHTSCNVCLTDLRADSPEALSALAEEHGVGKCRT